MLTVPRPFSQPAGSSPGRRNPATGPRDPPWELRRSSPAFSFRGQGRGLLPPETAFLILRLPVSSPDLVFLFTPPSVTIKAISHFFFSLHWHHSLIVLTPSSPFESGRLHSACIWRLHSAVNPIKTASHQYGPGIYVTLASLSELKFHPFFSFSTTELFSRRTRLYVNLVIFV